MSALIETQSGSGPRTRVPLLRAHAPSQIFAWRGPVPITCADFLAHVEEVAAALPPLGYAVNLCEDRYHFIVAFAAVVRRGQINLLPPSRAPQAVAQVLASHEDTYIIGDCAAAAGSAPHFVLPALPVGAGAAAAWQVPLLGAEQVLAIGYTSGSTGAPKPNPKTYTNLAASNALNAALLHAACAEAAPGALTIVATVPAQHMYGLEMSVLLPLLGGMSVHAGRPLFAEDVARALAEVPEPRLLVTTPVHLRALLRSNAVLPRVAAVVSATAPLPRELAIEAEQRYATRVIEVFGSTESCVIAHRRTARESVWHLYDGVELRQQPDGTVVEAEYFTAPVVLADIVELLPGRRFSLSGRNSDLLEIAGKRASLGDLTRCLLGLAGVLDGVIFQLDPDPHSGLARIAALVVAPTRDAASLLAELRAAIDPVFLPRPLRRLDQLPRNEAGKLPRAALLAALQGAARE